MDFKTKNFGYSKMSFSEFIEAIKGGEKLYLRSLSAENPSDTPADLGRDFPAIAADFQLPPELKMVAENAHSSPLRISGPVNMWLHYDVCPSSLASNPMSDEYLGNGQRAVPNPRA
jgi:tRNA wybutosine-synthesizing protein 4